MNHSVKNIILASLQLVYTSRQNLINNLIFIQLCHMQNKQFLIDPWRNQFQQSRQDNQNCLRKFVQFIDKANYESFRLKKENALFNDGKLQISRDEKSYFSVKDRAKRTKTQSPRNKLRSFVQNPPEVKSPTATNLNKMQIGQQSKVKASYFNHVIALAQRANIQQQKLIRFLSNQRQQFQSPKRKKRSQSTNQLSRQQQCLIRRNLTKKQIKPAKSIKEDKPVFEAKNSSTIVANQDKVKKLRSFFFKTIDHDNKNDKSYNLSYDQKKCDIKLKNMLQKSNRKKKKIQELFKPKQYMDRINIERTINANKIYQIETIDSTRTLQNPSIIGGQSVQRLISYQSIKKGKYKRKAN